MNSEIMTYKTRVLALIGLISSVKNNDFNSEHDPKNIDLLFENAHLFLTDKANVQIFKKLKSEIESFIAKGINNAREEGVSPVMNAFLIIPKSSDLTKIILEAINVDSLSEKMMLDARDFDEDYDWLRGTESDTRNFFSFNDRYSLILKNYSADKDRPLLNLLTSDSAIVNHYQYWIDKGVYEPSLTTIGKLSQLQITPQKLDLLIKSSHKAIVSDDITKAEIIYAALYANMRYVANYDITMSGQWRSRFIQQKNINKEEICQGLWKWAHYKNVLDKMEYLHQIPDSGIDTLTDHLPKRLSFPGVVFYGMKMNGKEIVIENNDVSVLIFIAAFTMLKHVEYYEGDIKDMITSSHDVDATSKLLDDYKIEASRLFRVYLIDRNINPYQIMLSTPRDTNLIQILTWKLDDSDKADFEQRLFLTEFESRRTLETNPPNENENNVSGFTI